jgi:hypothetical protein
MRYIKTVLLFFILIGLSGCSFAPRAEQPSKPSEENIGKAASAAIKPQPLVQETDRHARDDASGISAKDSAAGNIVGTSRTVIIIKTPAGQAKSENDSAVQTSATADQQASAQSTPGDKETTKANATTSGTTSGKNESAGGVEQTTDHQPNGERPSGADPMPGNGLNGHNPPAAVDLTFFKKHLLKGMTKADVGRLIGPPDQSGQADQSGEPISVYYFLNDPSYVPNHPADSVDEEGLLAEKVKFQLVITWDDNGVIKSYIVFYKQDGRIGEWKRKFYSGPYPNE